MPEAQFHALNLLKIKTQHSLFSAIINITVKNVKRGRVSLAEAEVVDLRPSIVHCCRVSFFLSECSSKCIASTPVCVCVCVRALLSNEAVGMP